MLLTSIYLLQRVLQQHASRVDREQQHVLQHMPGFLPFAAADTSGHKFDASCLIWDASVRRQSGLAIREIRVLK